MLKNKSQERSAGNWKVSWQTGLLPKLPVIFPILIIGFICFFNLNRVALIDLIDEGLYANAARQMIESGDWVTPRYGSIIFLDKPPLTLWFQAFFIRLLGETPMAARLPSALAACLTSLALLYWARSKGLGRVGWLAALIYVLSPLVAVGLARVAMLDSALTLWLTLAIIGWVEGYRGNRKGYLLMAAAMGLAVMTKGMIGVMLPCLTAFLWIVIRRDWSSLREVPWLAAAAIFLLIILPWHVAAWRANSDIFFYQYIVHHHFQRFLGQSFSNQRPFWNYIPVLALAIFPWMAFVPLAWWQSLRNAMRSEKQSEGSMMAMWGLWAAVIVLFFSLSGNKLASYILPALPALALLGAWRLDSIWQAKRRLSATETTVLLVCGGVTGIVLLTAGVLGLKWRNPTGSPSWLARQLGWIFNWKEQSQGIEQLWIKLEPLTDLAPYWIALGILFLISSIIILVFWRDTARIFMATVIISLSIAVLASHFLLPAWSDNEAGPLNRLAERTRPALERGEPLVMYQLHPKRISLRYMLGHTGQLTETFSPELLQSIVRESGRGYILTKRDNAPPELQGSTTTTVRQEAAEGQWALWRYDR